MTEPIPWLKATQSIGRALRPGTELQIMTAGTNGKSIVVDYESDFHTVWADKFMRPHYIEYVNSETGENYWKKSWREPGTRAMYVACKVVRHNTDGTYEYIKNRETGEIRKLTEKEIMWMLLHV